MPQHGPTDRDPEPDSPGNRHIPPKLTMQLPEPRLHGTGETARLGPSKSSRATAHRETGESRYGPPAPPPPAGPGRADGIQRDVPRGRGPIIRRPRVANPSYVSWKSEWRGTGDLPSGSGAGACSRFPLPCHGMGAKGTGLAIGHLRPGHRDPCAHCPRYARRCTCGSSWPACRDRRHAGRGSDPILSDDFRGPAAADVLKMRPGTCSPPASWARTGCNERLGFAASPTGQISLV